MCQSLIENTFLSKIGQYTQQTPVINKAVEMAMDYLIPQSVTAQAGCAPDTTTNTTKGCVSNGRGFDSLVSPQPCPSGMVWGYVNYFMWVVWINGQKRSYVDYNQRSCSTWNYTTKSCHPGFSDSPC